MRRFASICLTLIICAVPALAESWALDGFDPVEYRSGRAVPGKSEISVIWQDKQWHFTSNENRARFEADPRSYAPAFDGLCVVSLSKGRHVEGDPRYFVLVGNTVYLTRSAQARQNLIAHPRDIVMQARRTLSAPARGENIAGAARAAKSQNRDGTGTFGP